MAETKQALVERLFKTHGNKLRNFFFRRVRSQSEAVELAQEVYVRMLQVRDTEAILNPEAYLFTVAANLAREHNVLKRRVQSTVDIDDPTVQTDLAELPAFGSEIDTEQRIKRLREVLRQLSPKCQAAVILQGDGLSYEQIAHQLNVSTHMVKKYLSRALVHCRRRMARWG